MKKIVDFITKPPVSPFQRGISRKELPFERGDDRFTDQRG